MYLYISGQFKFQAFPKLVFFKTGEITGVDYSGAYDVENLMRFVNEKMGRGPDKTRVRPEQSFINSLYCSSAYFL